MDSKMMRGRHPGVPDDRTLDRILSGTAAPEDVPPGMRAVTQLLRAVASPRDEAQPATGSVSEGGAPQDSPPDHQVIAAMVSVIAGSEVGGGTRAEARSWGRSTRVRSPLVRLSRAAAVAALALFLMTGMAFAGVLPGPMQDAARSALSKVGLTVPGGDGQQAADLRGTEGGGDHDSAGRAGGRGPDPAGPAHQGLCDAYRSGHGGEQGGKNDSTAFANLQDAAAAAGQTIDEFCGTDGQGEDPSHGTGHGHGQDGNEPGHGKGHDAAGDQGEDQGGNPSGDAGSGDTGSDSSDGSNGHGSGQSGTESDGHGHDSGGGD
jgi:hypothetical protein